MLIRLSGIGELDGEYELATQPTTKELIKFRKAFELSPSELVEILAEGGVETVPLYVYTALNRAGRPELAARVIDVPYDQWQGADLGAGDQEQEDAELPPGSGSDEPGRPSGAGGSSGATSRESSELPA